MATNRPPSSGIRVPVPSMRGFITALFERAGMSAHDSELISVILVDSDLHGVFSHGTQRAKEYIGKIVEGRINPRPEIRVVRECGSIRVFDGDGGLGHLPLHQAAAWAVTEAKRTGLAAATTRNHNHIGAAGTYARMALEHDCVGVAVSSRRITLDRGRPVRFASPGSPISVAVPANEEPALVMDQGVLAPWNRRVFARYPSIYLKDLALGSVLQALGGILAGIYAEEVASPDSRWQSDQGAFVAVFDVASFMPVDEFKSRMDRYIRDARSMKPFPGLARADLAGGPERRRYYEYVESGIPVSPDHEASLNEVAVRVGVSTPFAEFEHTRFGYERVNGRLGFPGVGRRIVRAVGRRLGG